MPLKITSKYSKVMVLMKLKMMRWSQIHHSMVCYRMEKLLSLYDCSAPLLTTKLRTFTLTMDRISQRCIQCLSLSLPLLSEIQQKFFAGV